MSGISCNSRQAQKKLLKLLKVLAKETKNYVFNVNVAEICPANIFENLWVINLTMNSSIDEFKLLSVYHLIIFAEVDIRVDCI